jgi:uncharacterized membrane protein (DUF373 family)
MSGTTPEPSHSVTTSTATAAASVTAETSTLDSVKHLERPLPILRERTHALLEVIDDLLHVGVALVLVALAGVFFVYILVDDFRHIFEAFPGQGGSLPAAILTGVNDVLFVVIILEILRTVTAHLKEHAFALRPFIIIGIISAVRHLLIVGARMSVGEGSTAAETGLFNQHLTELALNGVLALVLVFAYWLITRIRE